MVAWADLKLPEGAEASDAEQTEFLAVFNDPKMSMKDRAQALIDLQQKAFSSAAEKRSSDWDALQESWQQAGRADPTIGGANYDANVATVNKLVTQYGTPELNNVLTATGAGNHPEMLKFLLKLAPLALEGGNVPPPNSGGKPTDDEAARLARMYPTMQPKQ